MKRHTPLRVACAALLICTAPISFAQRSTGETPTPARTADTEETVILSPFEVSSYQPARYQADEAASGGRIVTSVLNTPSTVTVLTSDFVADIGGNRIFDSAKYVAGINDATIPNAQDRANIRGFAMGSRLVDGFSTPSQANYDHAAIDRMEISKGPDSVLQPAGVPGGSINLVTKKPQWTFGGSLKAQLGEYDTNRVEADVTGPINDRFAYRLIAAAQDNKSWVQGTFRESLLVTPSLTWRIAPATNLTLRYEYYDARTSNLEGIPMDPMVGPEDAFRTMPGVPLDFSPAPGDEYSYRMGRSNTVTMLLTSVITDRLSVRLAGRLAQSTHPNGDFRWGLDAPGGSINPFTGKWEGGVLWQNNSADPANPNWVSGPAPQPSNVFQHVGTYEHVEGRYRDLQNDWSYIVDNDLVKSSTLVGFAYSYVHENIQSRRQELPDFTVNNVPHSPVTTYPNNTDRRGITSRYQAYLTQTLEFFESRLVLSGGVSHTSYNGVFGNKLSAATFTTPAGMMYPGSGSKATYNYGIVLKPITNVSVYYGHSENAVPANNFQQTYEGRAPFSEGTQDEIGLKLRLFDGRILASLAYYEIEQTGYTVFNPLNVVVPPPPVLLPDLVLSRKASGYELQIMGSITPQLSIIASAADTKNRDPNGVMLRGSAEDTASGFVRYEFTSGALTGLSAGLGANWSSKRSVENVSGLTPMGVPIQPRGYLPARTLMDAYIGYERGPWSYRVDVTNLTDKVYYSSLSWNIIQVANPRAFSGSVTYKF